MNINTIIQKINNFNSSVIETGFFRDIQEYINTLGQPQNSQNILLLKDIADKTHKAFLEIVNSDLPDDLKKLIPDNQAIIFTRDDNLNLLEILLTNTQINTADFHVQLTKILNDIKKEINNNLNIIENLKNVLLPYYQAEGRAREENSKAVISLVFKETSTITNLKKFYKSLDKWNRAIYLYHQLVMKSAPKDVELVNIENGSLDVILNIDVNVAINFTEIVEYGLKAFAAYLIYKSTKKEIVQAYFGNPILIKAEKEIETELLNNIGTTLKSKLLEQHKQIVTTNPDIKPDGKEKIADEVSKIIAEHIVAGNDIKLIVHKIDDEKIEELKTTLNKESLKVRNGLKQLNAEDKKLLLDTYIIKNDDL